MSSGETQPAHGEEGADVRLKAVVVLGMCAAALACAAAPPALAPTRLTDGAAAHRKPAWSPDGQWVAYVATGSWGDAVCVARRSDGITHAVTGALEGSVVGRLQWLADPMRVAWVTDHGHVGTLGLTGEVVTAELSLPTEPRGLATLDKGHALAACSGSSVVELQGALAGAATPLPIGSVNSDIASIAATPDGEGLVIVDAGSALLWRRGEDTRALLAPSAAVAEWCAVSSAEGCESVIVTARGRKARMPDRVCALDPRTGSVATVLEVTSAVAEAVPVPGTGAIVAIVAGRLTLIAQPGADAVTAPSGSFTDSDPSVSPDGALVVFSSAGRDDTNLNGRIDPGDPPNLYTCRLRADEGGPAG